MTPRDRERATGPMRIARALQKWSQNRQIEEIIDGKKRIEDTGDRLLEKRETAEGEEK
jgi:hypothetical protein